MILLVPLGLELAYIWQAGLDLHTPKDMRGYLELRRRGHEDIAGKALWTEARRFDGPLTVLMPGGTGDSDLTAQIGAYLAKHGYAAGDLNGNPDLRRRFFEAHAFALADLKTASLNTLDGQVHSVVCGNAQPVRKCTVDGEPVYSYFGQPQQDGNLYLLGSVKASRLDFLPFLDASK